MRAQDIIPTVMVRNEERYIADVLRPLVYVFGRVLLGDTGSTDATLANAASIPGVQIIQYGRQSQAQLTDIRQQLGLRAHALGAPWQLLCDGDELYSVPTLEALVAEELPAHARTGFTKMVTLDEDENGNLWEMADRFDRQALLPSDCRWMGTYPFDVPDVFNYPAGFFYFTEPAGFRYHALHLHRLVRSGYDDEVLLRLYKRKRFGLQELSIPRTVPFNMTEWRALSAL